MAGDLDENMTMIAPEADTSLCDQAQDLVRRAKSAGADYADILCFNSLSLSITVREGKREMTEQEEDKAFGLRVICGKKSACISTSDMRPSALQKIAEQAVSMARHVPEDEFLPVPSFERSADSFKQLKTSDQDYVPDIRNLEIMAHAMERPGLDSPKITQSEGADASWTDNNIYLISSTGFVGHYRKTRANASACFIAGEGDGMERDYAYDSHIMMSALEEPDAIGKRAVERTLARLHPRKGKTGKFPVIFDREVADSILRHFLASVNGGRIAKDLGFLRDKMGQKVLNEAVNITDDPTLDFMPSSKPFDAEGHAPEKLMLAERGILQNWTLDMRTAAKLGLSSNGRASRGLTGQPSPSASNSCIENGVSAREDIIADIKDGFLVTELMGSSVSLNTGHYSRGASGFWIENGKIAYPVCEMTLGGNLQDIFLGMIPCNDGLFRYGCDSPSLFIPELTVAAN